MPFSIEKAKRLRSGTEAIRFLSLLALLFCIYPRSALTSSISAKGSANLYGVPLGRDSLYSTSIVGLNTGSKPAIFTFQIVKNEDRFYEPIPDPRWIVPYPDTSSAPPGGGTRPLQLITRFPDDPTLANRRFVASAIVQQASSGMLSLGVALKIRIETQTSNEIPKGMHSLAIAPIVATLGEDEDSLKIFNGGDQTDTVKVYWSRHLGKENEPVGVELRRHVLLWKLPAHRIILKPGQQEWIFYKKNKIYSGSPGYIVCIGRNFSLYCRLEY